MTTRHDVDLKRQYVENWLDQHAAFRVHLLDQESPIKVTECLGRVGEIIEGQPASEFIYVLTEERPEGRIPAYIGKSKHPVTRWRSHLQNLDRGLGSYARWRDRLLHDDLTRYSLDLYAVGNQQILFPPIPDFPTTIGAIEYQLIGLAEDAYPYKLLNHEGQSR